MKQQVQISKGFFYDYPESEGIEVIDRGGAPENQYWERQSDYPKFFFLYNPHLSEKSQAALFSEKTVIVNGKLKSLSNEDSYILQDLLAREVKRITDGVFVMINGSKVYLPGCYYGMLQWCKLYGNSKNEGYGEFRESQLKVAYAFDKTLKDIRWRGFYCHKTKKSGITAEIVCLMLMDLIVHKQSIYGTMSKNNQTVKEGNMRYFLTALRGLPHCMRPLTSQKGWATADKQVEFSCQSDDMDEVTNNLFIAVPTVASGMDGFPPLRVAFIDESTKYPKDVPISSVVEKTQNQCRNNAERVGICILSSYPNEDDSDSFMWCREFYSKCKVILDNGISETGYLPITIGILESTNDTFDKYGVADQNKAREIELAERAKCKNFKELQARRRQSFFTEEEGWQLGGGGSTFNAIILADQNETLKQRYLQSDLNYFHGNLNWSEGRMTPVVMSQSTHSEIMENKAGKWKFYVESPSFFSGKVNLCFQMAKKVKMINNERTELYQPPEMTEFVGAIDPVDYGTGTSENAFVIRNIKGDLVATYFFRHENPDSDLDEFIKGILFFGCYVLPEGNRKNAYTTLEKQGLHYFLLVKHPNGQIKPYGSQMDIKAVTTTKDLKAEYIRLTEVRLVTNQHQFASFDVNLQLMEFDPENTEKFDYAVAWLLSEVALDAVQTYYLSKKAKNDQYQYMGQVMAVLM